MVLCASAATSLIHSWFDPLQRWGYPSAAGKDVRPALLYLPGLDGGNGSPFVQFPGLGQSFALAVQDVSFASSANAAGIIVS